MSHDSTAKRVRIEKEKNPQLYCPKCLWRTGGGFCPRHTPDYSHMEVRGDYYGDNDPGPTKVCTACGGTRGKVEGRCPNAPGGFHTYVEI